MEKGGWVYIMANRYRGGMYVGVTSNLIRRVQQHREGAGSIHAADFGKMRLVYAERHDEIAGAGGPGSGELIRQSPPHTSPSPSHPAVAPCLTRGLAFLVACVECSLAPHRVRGDVGLLSGLYCFTPPTPTKPRFIAPKAKPYCLSYRLT